MLEGLFGPGDEAADHTGCSTMPIDYSGYATKAKMMKEPIPPRGSTGMVGLSNQGATCYLNALIQTLYMTPELRAGLFAVDPAELGVHLIEAWETEQACKASKGEVEADDNLLATLVSLGVEEAKARSALIQTKNAGLDQALEHMDRSDKVEEAAPAKRGAPKPRFIPLELQRLFSELQLADAASVSTQELTSRGFQWQSAEGRVQHDAHELNRLLIDALERSLRRTSGAALCKALYEGTLTNQVLCRQCGALSLRSEPFYDLNLQVLGMTDAVQALLAYVREEVLSGDSAYWCDPCGGRVQGAVRGSRLSALPPLLTLSLSRFRIDASTQWQRVKLTERWAFPLLLDMHRLRGADLSQSEGVQQGGDVEEVRAGMLWVEELHSAALAFARQHLLAHPQARSFTPEEVAAFHVQHIAPHLAPLMGCEEVYVLHSVVVHRGSAHSGHYRALIRDHLRESCGNDAQHAAGCAPGCSSSGKSSKGSAEEVRVEDRERLLLRGKRRMVRSDSRLARIIAICADQRSAGRKKKKKKCKKGVALADIAEALGPDPDSDLGLGELLRRHPLLFEEVTEGVFAVTQADQVERLSPAQFAKEVAKEVEVVSEEVALAAALAASLRTSEEVSTQGEEVGEEALAEQLLVGALGRFLDFDDQRVRPCSYRQLAASAEGVDCAYLLVYRKLQVVLDMSLPCWPAPPAPPLHYRSAIEHANTSLAEARSRHAHSLRSVTLRLFALSAVRYDTPLFYLDGTPQEVQADGRWTIAALLRECGAADGMCVSVLQALPRGCGGHYLSTPLAPEGCIAEVLAQGTALLLHPLGCVRIGKEVLYAGWEHTPEEVTAVRLHPVARTRKCKRVVLLADTGVQRGAEEMRFLPGSCTPEEVLLQVAHLLGVTPLDAVIHSYTPEEVPATELLFARGELCGRAATTSSGVRLRSAPWLRHLLVEHYLDGGLAAERLGPRLSAFAAKSRAITIRFPAATAEVVHREGGATTEEVVALVVHGGATVCDLKRAALLCATSLSDTALPRVCSCTSLSLGEEVLTDEGCLLSSIVKIPRNGSQLLLLPRAGTAAASSSSTSSAVAGEVTLLVCCTSSAGKRSAPVTLQVPLSATVKEVREAAGCALLALPQGWLAAAEGNKYRLRGTNWLREAAELLAEEDLTKPSTSSEVRLRDCNLRGSWDSSSTAEEVLLLLEEGPPLRKGAVGLAVYAWPEQPLRLLGELTISARTTEVELRRLLQPLANTSEEVRDLLPTLLPGTSLQSNGVRKVVQLLSKHTSSEAQQTHAVVVMPGTSSSGVEGVRLYVQQLANTAEVVQGATAELVPAWPPTQVVMQGGARPSAGHLLRPLHAAFPELASASALRLYKYSSARANYLPLPLQGTKGTVQQALEGLRDGDLLCVTNTTEEVSIMTATMLAGRKAKESKPPKPGAKGEAAKKKGKAAGRRPEAALVLKVDDDEFEDFPLCNK